MGAAQTDTRPPPPFVASYHATRALSSPAAPFPVFLRQKRVGHCVNSCYSRAAVLQNALHVRNVAIFAHQIDGVDLSRAVRADVLGQPERRSGAFDVAPDRLPRSVLRRVAPRKNPIFPAFFSQIVQQISRKTNKPALSRFLLSDPPIIAPKARKTPEPAEKIRFSVDPGLFCVYPHTVRLAAASAGLGRSALRPLAAPCAALPPPVPARSSAHGRAVALRAPLLRGSASRLRGCRRGGRQQPTNEQRPLRSLAGSRLSRFPAPSRSPERPCELPSAQPIPRRAMI